MIKKVLVIAVFWGISFSTSKNSLGQFINIQLNIEPELSTKVEQSLNFGIQVTNSGLSNVDIGDPGMGVFSIRALYTQSVRLQLMYPDSLVSEFVDDTIPLQLSASYSNFGKDDPYNSIPLINNTAYVTIYDDPSQIQEDIWQQMFVYVYGSIDIKNIANGIYTGDVTLIVEYE